MDIDYEALVYALVEVPTRGRKATKYKVSHKTVASPKTWYTGKQHGHDCWDRNRRGAKAVTAHSVLRLTGFTVEHIQAAHDSVS